MDSLTGLGIGSEILKKISQVQNMNNGKDARVFWAGLFSPVYFRVLIRTIYIIEIGPNLKKKSRCRKSKTKTR